MTEKKKSSFFDQFHTNRYTGNDSIIKIILIGIVLLLGGQILNRIPEILLGKIMGSSDFALTFQHYFDNIGVWIFCLAWFWFIKYNRPILTAIGPKMKGNTWKMLVLGLLVGFVQNGLCTLGAILHGDIYLSYDRFEVIPMILLLFAVFVQSSSEELICRGFMYQRLKRGYRSPLVWILGNSLVFSALHLFNPGITVVTFLNIILIAVFYSLILYYFDNRIWFTMAAHTGWNYTQNILFGLPNSGQVLPYSFMKLDASNARNSWVYDVKFGVEGTVLACLVILVSIAVIWYFGSKRKFTDQDVWDMVDAGA